MVSVLLVDNGNFDIALNDVTIRRVDPDIPANSVCAADLVLINEVNADRGLVSRLAEAGPPVLVITSDASVSITPASCSADTFGSSSIASNLAVTRGKGGRSDS